MSVQLNVNVSGFTVGVDHAPTLLNDDPARVAPALLNFDEGSVSRGNFHWVTPPPPGGWTLVWGGSSRRVWLSEQWKESEATHAALPDGWINESAILGNGNDVGFPPILAYKPERVEPIIASGVDLLVDGQRYVQRGATAFYMFGKFLRGEEPVLYPGADTHRVMLTLASIPDQAGWARLDPSKIGGSVYFPHLDAFFQWAARKGTRLDVCCLADLQMMGLDNKDWAQGFVRDVVNVMRPYTHLTFDLGNEPWNSVNGWRREWFTRPNLPFLCTAGSFKDAGKDDYGYGGEDPWDAYQVHGRRDGPENEWKGLAHAMLGAPSFTWGKAVLNNEGMKFGENYLEGKQYADPRVARMYGKAMRAANGGHFHSDAGCFNNPLGPIAEQCRAAFFEPD